MLDRIAQIVIIVFSATVLALLVAGMAVSCRRPPAGSASSNASPTPGPGSVLVVPPPTPIVSGAVPGGATATPTPGAAEIIVATPVPATAAPETATGQGATGGTGSNLTPGLTVMHTVSRGEWLLQIARCYGVQYESILAVNRIPIPDYILPGQIFTVPAIGSIGPITGPPCVVAYIVAVGDTWELLAQRFNTTTAILQRANPGSLTVGRSIWVPRVP